MTTSPFYKKMICFFLGIGAGFGIIFLGNSLYYGFKMYKQIKKEDEEWRR